jgi:DnaJ-class molecular chaperone
MVYVKCDSCDGKGYTGTGAACPKCHGFGKLDTILKPTTGKAKKQKGK